MVERKLYKTKLCVLYERGHCPRQSCSFAHGDVELRRFSDSFGAARRDYRGSDLRDKLDRRPSPPRRYSPRRDTRGRHAFHAGYSPSRSLSKNSDRKRRKKQYLDDHSDYSGSLKISDGTDNRFKEPKNPSSHSRYVREEQLKQVQLDIDKLEGHKRQLQVYLEERTQEADSLTSRIQELESQLRKEKEDSKRITSKIKKFIRAHNRHLRIQHELKRSQARLHKLADQLGSDATRSGVNGDDSSIDIVSDGEPIGNHVTDGRNELQNNASLDKKRLLISAGAADESKIAKLPKEGFTVAAKGLEKKSSRWNGRQINENKETEVPKKANGNHKSLASDDKHKQGNNGFNSIPSADKLKYPELGPVLPPTSMAAHAVDEYIDVVEAEEKRDVVETASANAENGAADKIPSWQLPLPPPPPVPKNAYSQYEDNDQNVDVVGLEEEMTDVDIV